MQITFKWIIGDTCEEGQKCLVFSIRKIRKLFPTARLVICHNCDVKKIPKKLVDLTIDQRSDKILRMFDDKDHSVPYPSGPEWKLYTPRIDLNSWEVWIDNDIAIYDIPEVMKFQHPFRPFVCEPFKRSYSPRFDKIIPADKNYNTGIVGLPPNFDLEKKIKKHVQSIDRWNNHFHEQSIISIALFEFNPRMVSFEEIPVLWNQDYKKGTCGMHFVGLNNGYKKHWKKFKNSMVQHL